MAHKPLRKPHINKKPTAHNIVALRKRAFTCARIFSDRTVLTGSNSRNNRLKRTATYVRNQLLGSVAFADRSCLSLLFALSLLACFNRGGDLIFLPPLYLI